MALRSRPDLDRRAQSSLIGVVLVFGLVMLGTGVTLYLGSQAIADTEDQVSRERAELSFTQLDSAAAQVALGESGVQTVDLGTGMRGDVTVTGGGTISVRVKDGPTLFRHTLGRVEYAGGGTTVAYEGGGVWRGTGRESVMVSPPELHYRDGTLTMPVTVVSPGEDRSGNRLTVQDKSVATELGLGAVHNEIVVLEVESAHYAGWAQYFSSRLGDSAVTVDHGAETVSVELGRPEVLPAFESSVLSMGVPGGETGVLVGTGSANINGPVQTTGTADTSGSGSYAQSPEENVDATLSPLDPYIDERVASAPSDPDVTTVEVTDDTTTLSGGNSYYDPDGFTMDTTGESVSVELGGGNVTLVVDGDTNFRAGQLAVDPQGTDHVFKLYVTGDISMSNGGTVGVTPITPGSNIAAEHVQIYGTSTTQVGLVNNAYLEGVVYAPRRTQVSGINTAMTTASNQCLLGGPGGPGTSEYADFCVATGSAAVDGALVGAPTRVGQASVINYDSDLADVTPSLVDTDLAPALTFMHVSANQVRIDGAPTTGPELLDTPSATVTNAAAVTADGDHEVTVDWEASGEDLDSVVVTVIDATGTTRSDTVSASGDAESGTTTLTFTSPVTGTYDVYVGAVNDRGDTVTDAARVAVGGGGGGGGGADDEDDGDTYSIDSVSATASGGNIDVTVERTTTDADADLVILVKNNGGQTKSMTVVSNVGTGTDTYTVTEPSGAKTVEVVIQTDTGDEEDSGTDSL